MGELGAIDILVNNAGTVGEGGTLEDTSLEAWKNLFELNLFAAVDLVKRVVPTCRRRGGAHHQRLFGERDAALP